MRSRKCLWRGKTTQDGYSITELVAVTAVTGLLVLAGVPLVDDARRAAALGRAVAQVQGLLVRCRAVAVLRCRSCAVVFDQQAGGQWRCFVAEDGDDDGVRRSDIARGVDPVVGRVITIAAGGAGPGIYRREPVPDPTGRGVLGGDLHDPIRAGRGNMISFSSRGTVTPSSVYFTDFERRMVVLRIYGGTGRINRLSWQRGWSKWKQG